jgi:hypothetical protein
MRRAIEIVFFWIKSWQRVLCAEVLVLTAGRCE